MTAEQFLADMEAKAKAAINAATFIDDRIRTRYELWKATSPAAVLRLVGMVRHLAVGCDCDAEPCQYGHCTPTCRLKMAYTAMEERHD